MLRARAAAVAGRFYPGRPDVLASEVDRLLGAVPGGSPGAGRLRALVVPHAGYVYSGPVAAHAYARLGALSPPPRRVVLLGPSHFVPVAGLALPQADAFETPLGQVPLDTEAMRRCASLPQVTTLPAAHAREHSLEVQLPFLQRVLAGAPFTLVPLAVGRCAPQDVAGVLAALEGPDTLVLVSTDLSHYLSYQEARAVDGATARHVLALEPVEIDDACGAAPLNGLLAWARERGLRATLLALRSSGDTAGDAERVVGYGAFALEEPAA